MEIKQKKIIYDIVSIKRFRLILLFLIRVPFPILALLIFIQTINRRYLNDFKLNSEIFIYPMILIVGSAIISVPFLLYILIKEKRRSWIVTFSIMVLLPILIAYFYANNLIYNYLWLMVLMFPFYIYCYLLKNSVDEWIEEYEGQELSKERKIEKARRIKEEERWN